MNIAKETTEKNVQTVARDEFKKAIGGLPIEVKRRLQIIASANKYIELFTDYNYNTFGPYLKEIIDLLICQYNGKSDKYNDIKEALKLLKERNTIYRAPEEITLYCKTIGIVNLLQALKFTFEAKVRGYFFNRRFHPDYRDHKLLLGFDNVLGYTTRSLEARDVQIKSLRFKVKDNSRKKSTGTAAREAYDLKRTGKIHKNMHMMTPNHQKMVNRAPRKIVTVKRMPKAQPKVEHPCADCGTEMAPSYHRQLCGGSGQFCANNNN